jgi:hypothetical protein
MAEYGGDSISLDTKPYPNPIRASRIRNRIVLGDMDFFNVLHPHFCARQNITRGPDRYNVTLLPSRRSVIGL